MLLNVLWLVVGFILLIKGADWLVDGASSTARVFNVSQLVIGLTIVSFGTSAPELVVNILSAASGATDLAVGNLVGSNIANTWLVLGVAALIYPLTVKKGTVWKEIPLYLVSALAVFFLANDALFDGVENSVITRADGLVLLLLFAIFSYYTVLIGRASEEHKTEEPKRSWLRIGTMVATGLTGLIIGGRVIVDNAVHLANYFGISEAVIGLTVVALGTSLPEVATSAVAAWRKHVDIAVGNVIGSNIFNLLFVLPITALLTPISAPPFLNTDMLVMIVSAIVLLFAVFTDKGRNLSKTGGGMFLAFYLIYVGYLFWRG